MRTAIALVLLAACASGPSTAPKSSLFAPPTGAQLAAAEFGPPPSPNHQDQVRPLMDGILKDPESARYRFGTPQRGWFPRHLFDTKVHGEPHKHGHVFGWVVDFGVNEKNSYGGYAGEQAYSAFFVDGQLRGILQPLAHKDLFGYPIWGELFVAPAGPR